MSEGRIGVGEGQKAEAAARRRRVGDGGRRGGFTLFCDQRTECRLEGWKKKKGRSREERESKESDCDREGDGEGEEKFC